MPDFANFLEYLQKTNSENENRERSDKTTLPERKHTETIKLLLIITYDLKIYNLYFLARTLHGYFSQTAQVVFHGDFFFILQAVGF